YSLEEVQQYLASGQLNPTDLAIHSGLSDWVTLAELTGGGRAPAAGSADAGFLASTSGMTEEQSDFEFELGCQPDFSFLTVQIPGGETLKVEASAMASMDTNIQMKTKFKGGLGRFMTGESLFINEFTAEGGPGEIKIAPGSPGDMDHVYLNGDTIYLQNSAYVASGMNVELETKWQGIKKAFFSGESLFLIKCSGNGDLWFNTYGAMIQIDVAAGQDYVVDTGYIVAFTEGLDYDVNMLGGYKSLFFSGEGLVCRFSGQGKVWIQTRQVAAFTSWVYPFRPVKSSND
ncbi:MAG: TIGR00266 family protein, partial [Planctomycetota bacterium]|nr:TIGR00266 family protein [Planctomycetota bacterium]